MKRAKMRIKPPHWVQDAIFYHIFPDRFYNGNSENDPQNIRKWGQKPTRNSFFGGDLEGIICKLPYLEELGVNALYLNPIFKSPSNHKYDTTDYYKVDPVFGDKDTLKRLVRELHRRGMRIILDGVFNHCGDTFWAFQDVVKKGSSSKYIDWFTIKSLPVVKQPEPNYRCWMGVPSMPEFNAENPTVRKYILEVVKYWIQEVDIDGWRLDTVEFMPPDLVRDIRSVAKTIKKDVYVMGEVIGIATSWFKSKCLDAVMNYKLHELLIEFFAKENLTAKDFNWQLYGLERAYPDWANQAMFNLLDSHDRPRFLTLCKGNVKKMKLAVVFLMTYTGAPVIYYGDEVGMRGGEDPDCRRCMIWEEDRQNQHLLDLYKRMVKLRRESIVLRRGNFHSLYGEGGIYCFLRELNGRKIIVALNNSSKNKKVEVPISETGKEKEKLYKDVFTNETFLQNRNKLYMEIPAYNFKILSIIKGYGQ